MIDRNEVVRLAREAVGLPFEHQGRGDDLGLDCVGLILRSFRGAGWLPLSPETTGITDYERLPDGWTMRRYLVLEADEIAESDVLPGDIALMAFSDDEHGGEPQHVALFTPPPSDRPGPYIIHALFDHGVVEHRFALEWKKRTIGYYRLKCFCE